MARSFGRVPPAGGRTGGKVVVLSEPRGPLYKTRELGRLFGGENVRAIWHYGHHDEDGVLRGLDNATSADQDNQVTLRVRYLAEGPEREAFRVTVGADGKLRQGKGLLDTSAAMAMFGGRLSGWFIFAMDGAGRLYAADNRKEFFSGRELTPDERQAHPGQTSTGLKAYWRERAEDLARRLQDGLVTRHSVKARKIPADAAGATAFPCDHYSSIWLDRAVPCAMAMPGGVAKGRPARNLEKLGRTPWKAMASPGKVLKDAVQVELAPVAKETPAPAPQAPQEGEGGGRRSSMDGGEGGGRRSSMDGGEDEGRSSLVSGEGGGRRSSMDGGEDEGRSSLVSGEGGGRRSSMDGGEDEGRSSLVSGEGGGRRSSMDGGEDEGRSSLVSGEVGGRRSSMDGGEDEGRSSLVSGEVGGRRSSMDGGEDEGRSSLVSGEVGGRRSSMDGRRSSMDGAGGGEEPASQAAQAPPAPLQGVDWDDLPAPDDATPTSPRPAAALGVKRQAPPEACYGTIQPGEGVLVCRPPRLASGELDVAALERLVTRGADGAPSPIERDWSDRQERAAREWEKRAQRDPEGDKRGPFVPQPFPGIAFALADVAEGGWVCNACLGRRAQWPLLRWVKLPADKVEQAMAKVRAGSDDEKSFTNELVRLGVIGPATREQLEYLGHVPGQRLIEVFHHTSFLAGAPVAAAGEIKVEQGVIVGLTNDSGHFLPSPRHLLQVTRELKRQKADLGQLQVHFEGHVDEDAESGPTGKPKIWLSALLGDRLDPRLVAVAKEMKDIRTPAEGRSEAHGSRANTMKALSEEIKLGGPKLKRPAAGRPAPLPKEGPEQCTGLDGHGFRCLATSATDHLEYEEGSGWMCERCDAVRWSWVQGRARSTKIKA